jgi:hypothetical protein
MKGFSKNTVSGGNGQHGERDQMSSVKNRKNLAKRVAAALASILLISASASIARADEIRTVKVRFQAGANSATVKARIKGYETVDYLLGARAGQTMNVSMATDNGANYFNILAPGESDAAMFNGSLADNQFEGVLPATGNYRIRVYLMRSAARRKETANYRLEMVVGSGNSAGASAPSGDAKRDPWKRIGANDFDATGKIPCAQAAGQPMGSCDFGVVRQGNGFALIKISWPGGGNRVITFENGTPTGYDQSQADGGAKLAFKKNADLYAIGIGDQRFEMPEAVIYGG